jgi:hypothetical protein
MIQGDYKIKALLERNYRLAAVLFQNGVDIFKCMELSIEEACKRMRLEPGKLLLRINFTLSGRTGRPGDYPVPDSALAGNDPAEAKHDAG